MTPEVKLNQLDAVADRASYPLSRADARETFEDVRLVYADGGEPLVDVLDRVQEDQFESVEDLRGSILNAVPVEGVGEPGQSEGEG